LSTAKKSQDTNPALRGPLRIVSIGGGTGLSSLLTGLKLYASGAEPIATLAAIVTVTDDGGSSGRLRKDFAILPPGDIRNCMVALAEEEALLSQLFQYRFASGRGLKGHSFGNLFLTALTHLTGDFASAVRFACGVLASAGEIIPSTAENVVITAKLQDGTVVTGESQISKTRSPIRDLKIVPRRPKPLPEALAVLAEADLITIGPGSLFTSLIPNLLVSGIPRAICSSPAVKVYVGNLMGQPGETVNFTASDHVRAILRHTGLTGVERAKFLDYVVLNSQGIHPRQLGRYADRQALPVENDTIALRAMGLQIVKGELLAEGEQVRHNPRATAEIVLKLAKLGRRRRQIQGAEQAL